MLTLKFDIDKYSSLENRTQDRLKSKRTTHYICKTCHVQFQPKCTCVSCNRDVQKDMCKYTTKEAMTSADLLYQNAYDMYHILQTMKTNIYVHHVIKDYKKQVMKTQFYRIMENIHMQ